MKGGVEMSFNREAFDKGKWAEDYVARRLMRRGLMIFARRFRRAGFELDLVAGTHESVYAVEVKWRRREYEREDLQRLLPYAKRQALVRGLQYYLMGHPLPAKTLRIDLAIVWQNQLEYWPGAVAVDEIGGVMRLR